MNEKHNLRPLWDAILEVYKVFAAICERHGLRYCADSGTALGAIRHGGFIPWDDDMDLQMPRQDYEKFVEIAKRELPQGYAWLDQFNCPEYENAFGKVIVTNKAKVDAVARVSGLSLGQGIFVDVFPLDGYPDSAIERLWRRIQNILVAFKSDARIGWKSCKTAKSKIGYVIGVLIGPFVHGAGDRRWQLDFFERRAKRYPFGGTKKCVSIGSARYDDDKPFPYQCWGIPRKVAFDSVEMPVQENADGYLRAYFGEYMEMPSPSERLGTHCDTGNVEWRFGPIAG